jgi:hypothetical protein
MWLYRHFFFAFFVDPFLDQPVVPRFVPKKPGIDQSTQIDEDLFDFDFEWFF